MPARRKSKSRSKSPRRVLKRRSSGRARTSRRVTQRRSPKRRTYRSSAFDRLSPPRRKPPKPTRSQVLTALDGKGSHIAPVITSAMQHIQYLDTHKAELISSVNEEVDILLSAPLTLNELPDNVTEELIMKMVETHDIESIRSLNATDTNMSDTLDRLGGVQTLVYNATIPYTFILIQGLTTPERALTFEREYATFLTTRNLGQFFEIKNADKIREQAFKDWKTANESDEHPWVRYRWILSYLGQIGNEHRFDPS